MENHSPVIPEPEPKAISFPVKRQRKSLKVPALDYCHELSKCIGDMLMTTVNDDFRSKCFKVLDVNGGNEVGDKIETLANNLKNAPKKPKIIKRKK